jgi:streptogramin lyase
LIPCRKTVWAGTLSLFLAGCGGGSNGGTGAPAGQFSKVRGQVHGGQSPITGSTITLYAVGAGVPATRIATTTTDGNGNFDFGGGVTCTSPGLTATTLVYVTANGGNPGAGNGVDNSAISLIAALGQCQNASSVNIDEVTTVAAAYALSGFITTAATVNLAEGGTTTGVDVQTQAINLPGTASIGTGIGNAFATAAVLADPVSGATPVDLGTTQATAQQTVNGLANALAACVNTTGSSSAQCTELFACALPGASFTDNACSGGSGTQPGDVLGATLSVAHNPGLVSVAGVYDVAARNTVFSPNLAAAPNDWTISLNFTAGGFATPAGIAIDASGDVWIANAKGGVTELTPTGVPVSGSPFTGGGLNGPHDIAIDGSGFVWVVNYNGSSLTELDATGAPTTGSPFSGGGLYDPNGIAIDISGHVWVTNNGAHGISEFDAGGSPVSGSPFVASASNDPMGVAIDTFSDVWVANQDDSNLIELNTAGVPVIGSPFSGGGITVPVGVAISPAGNIWIANKGSNTLSEFSSAGAAVAGSPFGGGGLSTTSSKYANTLAVDASGSVWMANYNTGSISELDANGAPRSGSAGFAPNQSGAAISSVAIDASGNVWATNGKYFQTDGVIELVGAAAPTRTPLVARLEPQLGL